MVETAAIDEATVKRAAEKVEMARTKMLMKPGLIFFGHLLLKLDSVPTSEVAIAATDGKSFFYNPKVLADLTFDEIMGVLSHEVLHAAFNHLKGHRFYKRGNDLRDFIDAKKWNIATDCIVNQVCVDNGLQLPDSFSESADGKGYQLVFADQVPFDPALLKPALAYSAWELYKRIPDPPVQQIGVSCGLLDPGAGEGDGHPADMSDSEARLWEAAVRAAANADAKAAKAAGREPANIELIISELLKPRVDWKRELAEWLQPFNEDYSYSPPDRRTDALNEMMGEEIIWPGMTEGEVFRDGFLFVDTSGSIDDSELEEFVSEVYWYGKTGHNIWLGYCDADLHGKSKKEPFYELTPSLPPMPKGRGGTSFKPPFKAIKKLGIRPEWVIYFTDGYPNDGWPEKPPFPIAWVINNEEVDPPYGKVIRYEPRQKEDWS